MCCSGRHGHHTHEENAETYPLDPNRYCLCPGDFHDNVKYPITRENVARQGMCCGAQSGDDGLCDRCRTHCAKEQVTVEQSKEALREAMA